VVGDHVVGGEKAGLLVGEVLVEGAARDRGRLGDVGDRGRVVAALGDGVDQCGDDPLALVLDDELARQAVAAGGQSQRCVRFFLGDYPTISRKRARTGSSSQISSMLVAA
jgi:hypothetical protein